MDYLRKTLPPPPPSVLLALGDDAAVLAPSAFGTVVTVDLLTEGVDFLLDEHDPSLIGRKALAVNLSDLAAMGAMPTAVVVAVALPRSGPYPPAVLAKLLYEGMQPLLDRYSLSLIGGDTNTWDGGLVVSVTALGMTTKNGVLTRAGARAGDRILITGPLGGSRLERQFTFEPRIREILLLHEHYECHAAIDISDSFSLDLYRLCRESSLGAEVVFSRIPIHPDAFRWAKTCGETCGETLSAVEHALSDGEDFELILAVSPDSATQILREQPLFAAFDCLLYDVGSFLEEPGLWMMDEDGNRHVLHPRGYTH